MLFSTLHYSIDANCFSMLTSSSQDYATKPEAGYGYNRVACNVLGSVC